MDGFCTKHQMQMTERTSKTKFHQDGSPKTYFAHTTSEGEMCFGENMRKAASNGRTYTPQPPAPVAPPVDWDKKDRVIRRMSCQKQAIEFAKVQVSLGLLKPEDSEALMVHIKNMTDIFERDLEKK